MAVKRFSVERIRKGCVFLSVTLAHTHKTHNVLTIQYALHIKYYYTTTDTIYFVYEHDGQTNVKTVEISTGNAPDNNAYICMCDNDDASYTLTITIERSIIDYIIYYIH